MFNEVLDKDRLSILNEVHGYSADFIAEYNAIYGLDFDKLADYAFRIKLNEIRMHMASL